MTPEDELAFQLTAAGIPYKREFKAIPGRRYRWDFRLTGTRILLEVNGGTWTKGGHSTGNGIQRDYTKSNLALIHGWMQLTFSSDDVRSGRAMDQVDDLCKQLLTGETKA
jgi:very-short-patch-repair endonuclease